MLPLNVSTLVRFPVPFVEVPVVVSDASFLLDPAGTANTVVFVSGDDNALGASAVKAMRSASPFDQMSDRVRCLAGNPILATFRNPTVATN